MAQLKDTIVNGNLTVSGNITGKFDSSSLETVIKATLLRAHPVGSYYWSSSSADPQTLFGGTWVRIKDRFIYAQGDSGSVGSTGGSVTHTIGIDNLPKHTHGMSHQHSFNGSHTHQHKIQTGTGYDTDTVGFVREGEICLIGGLFERKGGSGRWTSYSNKYGHDYLSKEIVTIKGTTTGGRDTTTDGGFKNAALNTMPPYQTAYCWKRTA